ncbi:polyprenol monophosphomannose synthase [Nocardioides zeae]|uniref:Polyprenol monophosphomannose synthase n=1 Tax=Nocardioides imazamoxiresistens TaxID=3231893 RepID=A0ABU3Q0C3_9ACTN|nr:polyprenol monophosphomannose synthase [Nocardioides zeae]MDT9594962.1 polyprenol monophosphomannose synthase [Nocardioides zeae]
MTVDNLPAEDGDELHRILVVIPTYNEIENLAEIVARTLPAAGSPDVLVVDDGSPDGTGDLADRIAAADRRVHVLHRASKDGLGAAYLAGFAWALDHGYDVVVEMDADGSHRPEQLGRLLAALPQADLVLGSRWVPGGRVHDWPPHRRLLSRGGNAFVRRALRVPLGDATGGYRAFRASALRSLDLEGVQSQGYCFQVDLARRVLQAGLRVREVPIDFSDRELGTSKMSGAIVREAVAQVTRWGLSDRVHRRGRARVVVPPSPVVAIPPR